MEKQKILSVLKKIVWFVSIFPQKKNECIIILRLKLNSLIFFKKLYILCFTSCMWKICFKIQIIINLLSCFVFTENIKYVEDNRSFSINFTKIYLYKSLKKCFKLF